MPKLDDIRRALRGGDSPADIPPEKSKGIDLDKVQRIRGKDSHNFTMSIDGTDATLHFGEWDGHSVSDLAKKPTGRNYLNYIMREFKDGDLKEVVRYQLKVVGFPHWMESE